ncbi:ATP-binding cassette domain-containing protein [Gracilibacillus salitolerans]|uniref:ATP-binding cassette domain-containing protein n=1 Tax=Gracilibacillus salitolerans TaxID=2663022 RepID=A0A5Q2TQN4_9BACI|nr:ABC transporter ATP-binding protein [Gracilibacillus salitolerans]QGH36373.1 ATP-binding cassette domain-containing protein [Gracilibacillus salitolerans]
MADITLKSISKKFKKDIALDNINLTVRDKEFFVIFGPAGAGKTTLLNVIAGLYLPDYGNVYLNGEYFNHVEPEDRNIAMVFEDYALYPHLTVFENIASPLRSPKYKELNEIIEKEVTRVARILKIDHLLERNISELSNGQRQRVGLGRALVRTPNVFLMDEPITHLDAKLRHQMRAELKEMQKNLDTTTIYVTHDYLEALSLGDKIAILNEGKIEQIGTPDDIYYYPHNEFVASSFGEPEINFFDAIITEDKQLSIFEEAEIQDIPEKVKSKLDESVRSVRVGIRPKDIKYSFTKENDYSVECSVYSFEPLGAKAVFTVEKDGNQIRLVVPSVLQIDMDQPVYIELDINKAMFFGTDEINFLSKFIKDAKGEVVWQS